MPRAEISAGQLWRVSATSNPLQWTRGRARHLERDQIILITWVQPEQEGPAPWIREVELVSGGQLIRADFSAFSRAIRHGELELVQDVSGGSTM